MLRKFKSISNMNLSQPQVSQVEIQSSLGLLITKKNQVPLINNWMHYMNDDIKSKCIIGYFLKKHLIQMKLNQHPWEEYEFPICIYDGTEETIEDGKMCGCWK